MSSMKTKSVEEIHLAIYEILEHDKLPKENSALLQTIFEASRSLFDWKSVFDKPTNFNVTEEQCNQLREKGRICLQKKMMMEALSCFSRYIRLCHQLPENEVCGEKKRNQLIQQGYLGRSMIFYRVENYVRCIDDCDAALYYGNYEQSPTHDDTSQYVLYERKGKCYSALGNKMHAKTNFDLALEASDKANIPDKLLEAFKRQTNEAIKKLEHLSKEVKTHFDDNAVIIENTDNLNHANMGLVDKLHTSMGSKTTIVHSPDKGRYVVANENIDIGETILVENVNVSYSCFDAKTKCSKACHHCLSSICEYMAYFSPIVDGLGFCSWKCLMDAMKTYHTHERFIFQNYINELENNQTEEEIRCASLVLAFKTIVSQPASFYLSEKCKNSILVNDPLFVLRKKHDSNEEALSKAETQVKSLYNMETHIEDTDMEERVLIAIRSVTLLQCLKETKYFDSDCTTEEELHFLKLLFHFQFSIAYSVLQIYRVDGDVSGDIPLSALGSGIFDDLILFNHSCASNTTRFYQGKILENGQIATIVYLPPINL